MFEDPTDHRRIAIAQWLTGRRILVADVGASTRSCIVRVLQDLGARQASIRMVSSFAGALEALAEHKPHVILSDYHLGNSCGLRLAPLLRRIHTEGRERLFMLVTVNASQSAVADAAEEEVDRYVLKPFNHDTLRDYLGQAILSKVDPGPYMGRIERGRAAMARGALDEALLLFTEATVYSDRPALAYHYLGQAHLARSEIREAEESFRAGLVFNEIHYRCLTGLFELYRVQNRHAEAYEALRVMVENFPVSPRRLDAAISLAVETGNYEHVDRYFEVYSGLDFKTSGLSQSVSEALLQGAQHFLGSQRLDVALDAFQKASLTANKHATVLRRIVTSLVRHGRHQEAERFLKDFSPEEQKSVDYLSADLLVCAGYGTVARTIDKGRRLLSKGIKDPDIYETLIRTSVKAGLLESAEGLLYDAVQLWPDLKERFEALDLQAEAA